MSLTAAEVRALVVAESLAVAERAIEVVEVVVVVLRAAEVIAPVVAESVAVAVRAIQVQYYYYYYY